MVEIRIDEISDIIKEQIKNYCKGRACNDSPRWMIKKGFNLIGIIIV